MTPPVFTTIFNSPRYWEVRLLQQKLKSEGIESFVDNENITAIRPHHSMAFGGVSLRVYTDDIPRAMAILNVPKQSVSSLYAQGRCPVCGGNKVQKARWTTFTTILAMILFGIPFLCFKRQICLDCGKKWWE